MRLFNYLASAFTDPDRKRSAGGDSLFTLDGVRGLAVLIVIASHTNVFGMAGLGSLGVLLFFMLSGFVLTLPFVDRPEHIFSWRTLWHFYANRALRVVPVYLVAVIYIAWLLGEGWSWVFANISFVSGWTHLWSVAEEVRFYLLFPPVVAVLALLPNVRVRILALLAMIWLAWRLQYHHKIDMMTGVSVRFFFWFFLAGMLACFLYRIFLTPVANSPTVQRALGAAAIFVVVCIFTSSNGAVSVLWSWLAPELVARYSGFNGWHQPALWCVLLGVLLLSVSTSRDTLVARWMRSWFMRQIGLLSYSLYLFHVPVMIVLRTYKLETGWLFAATFAIGYLIAMMTYLTIEKPFLMLKPGAASGQEKFSDNVPPMRNRGNIREVA